MADPTVETKIDAAPSSTNGSAAVTTEQELPQSNGSKMDTEEDRPAVPSFPKVLLLVDKKGAEEIELIKRRLIIDGDGAGDDKRLTKLAETYFTLLNSVNDETIINENQDAITFKSLLKQTNGIRSNVAKTYNAIDVNAKAVTYWNIISDTIKKEMTELKTIVLTAKEKLADMKRNKKESQEREAFVKLLDQLPERDATTKELEKLQNDYKELQSRQAELNEQINKKKMYLNHLFSLVKRLDNEEVQLIAEAVAEAEEKVLSDVSMDLE